MGQEAQLDLGIVSREKHGAGRSDEGAANGLAARGTHGDVLSMTSSATDPTPITSESFAKAWRQCQRFWSISMMIGLLGIIANARQNGGSTTTEFGTSSAICCAIWPTES